jgi:predicted Zn-dependent protease with MMP-like domain
MFNSRSKQPVLAPETQPLQASGSCLFRAASFFLAFCILAIVIIQLPLSDASKLFLYVALLCAGLIAIWLTTPKHPVAHTGTDMSAAEAVDKQATDQDHTSPDNLPVTEIPLDYFEQLVQEALISIPDDFKPYMNNLAIIVENEPDADTLLSAGVSNGRLLLGLYHGTPLTSIGYHYSTMPERITIYQRAIEYYCHGDPDRIRQQVRATVLHEVAHHFGIDHHEMPGWLK